MLSADHSGDQVSALGEIDHLKLSPHPGVEFVELLGEIGLSGVVPAAIPHDVDHVRVRRIDDVAGLGAGGFGSSRQSEHGAEGEAGSGSRNGDSHGWFTT